MFAFNVGFHAKLFYIFEDVYHYLIDGVGFVINIYIRVLIVRLEIEGVKSIVRAYCLSKFDSIY